MEGMAGQPSNSKSSLSYRIFVTNDLQAANDDTSIPGIPTSLDLEFPCTTWEEVRQLLLLWQVPATDLPYWETLWRWGQIKASATTGQAEPATLVERSMEFCRRIQGTKESYECLVPERDGRMGTLCETIIGRRDRMRSHMGSHHLGVSEFPCEGQCGNNDW